MSDTRHHSTKHGPLAYGNGTKQRAVGYEFWGRRSSKSHGQTPGADTKRRTHRAERRDGKRAAQDDE